MDAKRFDHLTRTLSTAGSRRGLLHMLAGLPFLGWLAFVFGVEASAAKRRKSRDKVGAANHKHDHRRRKHRNKGHHDHKDKDKEKNKKQPCKPESMAQTCDGTCGQVKNNCQKSVDCGSCACEPACAVCRICNPETAECEADLAQIGDACGACRTCSDSGGCEECAVCCDEACCAADAVCHAQNDTCCEPESLAETCTGQCGLLANNCGAQVDCGPCACPAPCPVCQTCDAATGECVGDPGQEGQSCGDPWVCRADGSCVCEGSVCGNCNNCGPVPGTCQPDPRIVCTALDQCHDAGACDPETGLCTNPPKPDGTPCGPTEWCDEGVCAFCACGDPACFLFQWGSQGSGNAQFDFPVDVAVAPNGTVYVVDFVLNRVTYFDAAGVYQGQWGGPGSGVGQFSGPFGIAVSPDGGRLYVVDSGNGRVQIFGPTGTPDGQFGSPGTGPGQFSVAERVAISPDGSRVYVVDHVSCRVQIFAPDGTLDGQFGSPGNGPGEFANPTGVAVSRDGARVYVTDADLGSVQIFSPSGVVQGTFGSGNGQLTAPTGIAVATDGKVYVLDNDAAEVQIFTADGTFLDTFGGGGGNGNGEFSGPWGIAAAPDGTIYVADSGNQRVQAFCVAPE